MTLIKIMTTLAYLPANILSGLVSLLFGSTEKDEFGNVIRNKDGKPKVSRGLLGTLLDAIKYVARAFADLVADHKQAIAVAFWTSLLVAGAMALMVFLWPAALTAITTFTVLGVSIVSVVGANTLLQIGAVAALSFMATFTTTCIVAGVINLINEIRECCSASPSSSVGLDEEDIKEIELSEDEDQQKDIKKKPTSDNQSPLTLSNMLGNNSGNIAITQKASEYIPYQPTNPLLVTENLIENQTSDNSAETSEMMMDNL